MNKDYPSRGINTKSISNYYLIKYNKNINLNNSSLTDEEKAGNFKLVYIHKNKVLQELTSSLKNSSNENVVRDTIEVVKEYLNL